MPKSPTQEVDVPTLEDRMTAVEEEVRRLREKQSDAEETRAIAELAQKNAAAANAACDGIWSEVKKFREESRESFQIVQRILRAHGSRFDQVDARLDAIDTRFDRVDVRFDRVDARLDAMDTRFDGIDARFESIDGRFDGIDARFDRVEGSQIAANEMMQTILDEIRAK